MSRRQASEEFLELLAPVRDALYRHARRMAWNDEDATDIVQEAVMTAWREFGRFQRDSNFKAWMFRILINSAYRLNKKHVRHQMASLEDAPAEPADAMEREDAWASLLDAPDRLNELLDDRLVHALQQLGDDERQCLLLRIVDEFNYKEISDLMGMPLGTVMSHVHRGRARLRERLAALAVEFRLLGETSK